MSTQQIKDMAGLSDLAAMHPFFKTWLGKKIGQWLLDVTRISHSNEVNRKCAGMTSWKAANKMMSLFGIAVEVENESVLDMFPEGSFITVSNHAYGAIDGISLTGVMGKHRPDFKMMVNDVLLRITSLSDSFIGVKPQIGFQKERKQHTHGLKEILGTIRDGHPLCVFPAGAVSMYEDRDYVTDREWQESALKIIKTARVPVIPIYFHGYNFPYFYKLEKIHIALRTLFMAREVFNKQGYTLKISIGQPISVEEQNRCSSIRELGALLRDKTYALSGDPRLFGDIR